MLKLIVILVSIVFSYNTFAMSDLTTCTVKVDFEKSTDANYLYTGYGELKCNDDNTAMTIFSAIKSDSVRKNSKFKNIDKFSIAVTPEKFETVAHIFQTYKMKMFMHSLFIHFGGDLETGAPDRTIGARIITEDFKRHRKHLKLMEILPGTNMIIEQDQFWEDEEI